MHDFNQIKKNQSNGSELGTIRMTGCTHSEKEQMLDVYYHVDEFLIVH